MKSVQHSQAWTMWLKSTSLILLLTFVTLTMGGTGCSSKGSTSTVTLSLPPQWQAAIDAQRAGRRGQRVATNSVATLDHLILNVTAADFAAPIFLSWDSNGGTNAVPTTLTLENMSKGSGRLFQVLAVFNDGKGMSLQYGDSNQTISSDNQQVEINLNNIAGATTGEGRIAGRFMRAGGGLPTGRVNIRYTPPGKPSLIITSGDIFAGWFEFFAMQDIPLDYVLESGEVLFSQVSVGAASGLVSTGATKVIRASAPPRCSNDAIGSRDCDAGRKFVLGWFGAGVPAGTIACYDSTPTSNYGYYVNNVDDTQASWSTSVGDFDVNTRVGVLSGGLNSTTTACSNRTEFVDRLTAEAIFLENGDHLLNFRGPFKGLNAANSNSGSSFLSVTPTTAGGTTTAALSWALMPDVVGSPIDSIGIFVRQGPDYSADDHDTDYQADDGFLCNAMPLGFTLHQMVPISQTSATIAGLTTTAFAANTQIVLCPHSAARGGYLSTGIDWRGQSNGSSGTSLATQLAAQTLFGATATAGTPAAIGFNTCYPIHLVPTDANGNPSYLQSSLDLSFTSTTAGASFYADNSCTATSITGITAFYGERMIYYKAPSGSSGSITVTSTAGSQWTTSFFYVLSASPTYTNSTVIAPTDIFAYECFPLTVGIFDSAGQRLVAPGSGYVGLPTSTPLTYYSDSNCSSTVSNSQIGNIPFSSSTVSASYYAKYTGVATSLSLTPTSALNGTTATPKSVTVHQPGAPASVALAMPNYLAALSCVSAKVSLYDSKGHLTPAAGSTVITLNADSGFFFSDVDCTAQTNSFTISNGALSATAYYLVSAKPATGQVTVNTTVTGLTSYPQTITVSSAFVNALSIYKTGAVAYHACTPVLVQAGSAASLGSPVSTIPLTSTIDFLFVNSGNASTYWPDATCSNGTATGTVGNPVSIATGQSQVLVYMYNENTPTQFDLTANTTNSSTTLYGSVPYPINSSAPSTADELGIFGLASVRAGICQGFAVAQLDVHQNAVAPTSSLTMNLSNSVSSIYSDPTCTSTISGVSIGTLQSAAVFYTRATNAGGGFVITGTASGLTPATWSVNVLP